LPETEPQDIKDLTAYFDVLLKNMLWSVARSAGYGTFNSMEFKERSSDLKKD
jgi:hypothetical protein